VDSRQINIERLLEYMLDQKWHKDCEIFADGREIKIKYTIDERTCFLRYSAGPKQGFFWDIYGENFQSFELAVIALSNAPLPYGYRRK